MLNTNQVAVGELLMVSSVNHHPGAEIGLTFEWVSNRATLHHTQVGEIMRIIIRVGEGREKA